MDSNSHTPPATPGSPGAVDPAWLSPDKQLCFALYGATLAMTRTYRPLLQPLGLTYPQYLVMLQLWQADGVTVTALGEHLGLDSGTLTPLLKRLESSGYIRRTRDTRDERRVLLTLTPEGRALQAQAATIPPRIAAAVGCSLPEMEALRASLNGMRDRLLAAATAAERTAGQHAGTTPGDAEATPVPPPPP